MKTILLLHREELTFLYAKIAHYISDKAQVVNVAYSPKEEAILVAKGIIVDYVYTQLLNEEIDRQTVINKDVINNLDKLFITNSDGRFNLNSSIQSDRGFSVLNYEESLKLAQANYFVWKRIFEIHHVDIIVHEPCSLFFNHLAEIMCRAQGGFFLWHIMVPGENSDYGYLNIIHDDFTAIEVERNTEYYLKNLPKINKERCEKYIMGFRSNYNVFLQNLQPKATSNFKFWLSYTKCKIYRYINRNKYNRLKQNIDYWLNLQNLMGDRLRNLRGYRRYKIKFEEPVAGEKYYYYSFHLEPEAVVLYLGGGLYTNQVKLIENIAASLPPGYYLYVKDHPHEYAYRCANDYLRLMKIPNVRLLRSTIPGKRIIKDAVGIFTINGTAGFEGVMLGKQVYCFGKSYYTCCNRVTYIHNIRDLREAIYKNIDKEYNDDINFMAFVNGYLDSLHPGMIDFFMGRAETYGVDMELNARRIANDLFNFAETFCSPKYN